jgi:hypothetical protein
MKTTDRTDKQHSLYSLRTLAVELSYLGREVGAQDNCLGSQHMLELGGNHNHFCSKDNEISM